MIEGRFKIGGYYRERQTTGSEYKVAENIIKPPRFRIVRLEKLSLDSGAYCDRCKRCIRWVYWLLDAEKSTDEKGAMAVGSECVKIITGKVPHEIKQEWKEHEARARQNVEELDRLKKAKEWMLANQEIITSLERLAEGREHYLPIALEFLDTISERGTLTPDQLNFVHSLIGKAVNLVGIEEYNVLLGGLFALGMHLRLGRYDSNFIRDVRSRAVDYGFTYRQRDSLVSVMKKYRRQIQEILPKLRNYEKEMVDYYKLLATIHIL